MSTDLFRAKAIAHAGVRHFGTVRLEVKTGLLVSAAVLLLSVITAATVLANTTYARRQIVMGFIDESNMTRILAKDLGTMGELLVSEGDSVQRGQYLGRILNLNKESQTEQELLHQLTELENLAATLDATRQQTESSYRRSRARLRQLQKLVQNDLRLQESKVQTLQKQAERSQTLYRSGYLSHLDWISLQTSLLSEKQNLNALQQKLLSISREREQAYSSLQIELQAISRQMNETNLRQSQVRTQLEDRQLAGDQKLIAAVGGRVTRILTHTGDAVLPGAEIVHISRETLNLTGTAHLTPAVATRLSAGQLLRLKVDSGSASRQAWISARVLSVSDHRIAHPEFGPTHVARVAITGVPAQVQVLPGMRFESSVETERKKLFRWLTDPLTTHSFSWMW